MFRILLNMNDKPIAVDDDVLSCIFNPRYMNFELSTKLEPVSSRFRSHAINSFYSVLEKFDFDSVEDILYRFGLYRNNFKLIIKKLATYCPKLQEFVALNVESVFCYDEEKGDDQDLIEKNPALYLVDLAALNLKTVRLTHPPFKPVLNYERITNLEISTTEATNEQIADLASVLKLCVNLKSLDLCFHSAEASSLDATPILIDSINSLDQLENVTIELDADVIDCDEMASKKCKVFCNSLHSLAIFELVDAASLLITLAPLLLKLRKLVVGCRIDEIDATRFFHEIPSLQRLQVTQVAEHQFPLDLGLAKIVYLRSNDSDQLPYKLLYAEIIISSLLGSTDSTLYDRACATAKVLQYLESTCKNIGRDIKNLKLSFFCGNPCRDKVAVANVSFLYVFTTYCPNVENLHYQSTDTTLEECVLAANGFKWLRVLTFDPSFKKSATHNNKETIEALVQHLSPFVNNCRLLEKVNFYLQRRLRIEKLGFLVPEMHPLLRRWSEHILFHIDESLKPGNAF